VKPRTLRLLWSLVLLASLWPALRLALAAVRLLRGDAAALGPNPIETATHTTGAWALYLLLATLLITPLRRLLRLGWLLRFRRLLGLLSFTYASLHFLIFCLEHGLGLVGDGGDALTLAADLVKRPYITVGFLAFLGMLPLALTSTNAMIRRLGRRWQTLHRLVYGCALLAVLHFTWLVKADLRRPLLCGVILLLALGARLAFWTRELPGRLAPPSDDDSTD
jgi:sulfoxide reductase heme-binding subunit YedZ